MGLSAATRSTMRGGMRCRIRSMGPSRRGFRDCSLGTCPVPTFSGGKPIELTVMFGAGSAADVTARQLANGMSKFLHAPVPVVNRTGAAGALGYVYVSQRKPDGYSLIWNSNSISTTYHSGALSFNYTAFDPVARVVVENPALAVKTSSPWKTLEDSSTTLTHTLGRFASETPE